MSGDYSRQTFDPRRDFCGVFMQQGRVQLDADWNELMELLDRRLRAETTDIIGRGTVPKETPDGFKIQIAGGALTIGRGRIYVDGLLAENHGKAPLEFDSVLAEQRGTLALPYNEQPYLPNAAAVAPAPLEGGPHLVFVDVWEREVTYLQRPELIESAVGVDTTTRRQTVWQVRVLAGVGTGVTCATPDDQIPGWLDLTRSSAGRLSTAAVGVATVDDPCLIPPSGGYRGLENRLYRVEIHNGGAQGQATFKWSRDNGSIATSVTAIPALDTLKVARVGRDSVLRFNAGDWIEITDDWLELDAQAAPKNPATNPGHIRQIKKVDDATLTITLTAALPAGVFPTDPQGKVTPARHTRIRRWDQQGEVRDTNKNLLVDLNAPGSTGVIPVPATGTSIVLEDGVQITFDTPAGGVYRVGDYWNFAARTADASVETLTQAPPRGIHHHYCRLAVVTFPNPPEDCRHLWPPDFGGGDCCDCDVCVTAESHNSGALTIQAAVEQVKAKGATVCLGPGIYNLGETPIQITGAQSLRIRGKGWKTILAYTSTGSAVSIQNSLGLVVEDLTVICAATSDLLSPAVAVRNSAGVTLQRDYLVRLAGQNERRAFNPAIGMSGVLIATNLRENLLLSPIGIGNILVKPAGTIAVTVTQPAPLLTAQLWVQDNDLLCSLRGVSLEGTCLHTLETRFAGNLVNDCPLGGIVTLGWNAPGSAMSIEGNQLRANGAGIVVGTDETRISNNAISPAQAGRGAAGIALAPGLDKSGLDRCHVLSNRIIGVVGDGISIQAIMRSAMIKQNFVEGVGGGGIVMADESQAGVLSIENNQLLNLAAQANDANSSLAGIRVVRAAEAVIAGNAVLGLGLAAVQNPNRSGIQVLASPGARITGNEIVDIGPPGDFLGAAAGIECQGGFDRADVSGNTVRRSQTLPANPGGARWVAVLIRGSVDGVANFGKMILVAGNADGVLGFFGARAVILPTGRRMVTVQGNHLEAYGQGRNVFVGAVIALTFAQNRCLFVSLDAPVAEAQAGAIIASANHLQGTPKAPGLVLRLPEGAPFTVLGNITSGPIVVNGAALPAPWQLLNVVSP